MNKEKRKEIPPFRLVPQPLNDEARNLPKFKWAGGEIGTRHKLGGKFKIRSFPSVRNVAKI